jgi:hypothetical protein
MNIQMNETPPRTMSAEFTEETAGLALSEAE